MGKSLLSISAAKKAIEASQQTHEALIRNIKLLDDLVNDQFRGLTDPTIKAYLKMSDEIRDTLLKIGRSMDACEEYCRRIIDWIIEYSNT